MDRRGSSLRACITLVSLLAANQAAAPVAAQGQPSAKGPRIGYLGSTSLSQASHLVDELRQRLRELGYVEGQNIGFEYRWAEGKTERFPALAAELVRLKVDVIVAASPPAIRAAKEATNTIPIVMAAVADPLESELVASLARPGGNITGISALAVGYSVKWLELLKEAVPKASRVAILLNPTNSSHPGYWRETQVAARVLGVTLQSLEVRDPTEIDGAFAAMTKGRAGGLIVPPDTLSLAHRNRVVDLAAKRRLPAMYGLREFVEVGGLMAYGSSLRDIFRRAATYVDKILKGAKPADLPIEQTSRFDLVINLKTAKALGIKFPQTILIRADQVIQ